MTPKGREVPVSIEELDEFIRRLIIKTVKKVVGW